MLTQLEGDEEKLPKMTSLQLLKVKEPLPEQDRLSWRTERNIFEPALLGHRRRQNRETSDDTGMYERHPEENNTGIEIPSLSWQIFDDVRRNCG